MNIKNFPRLYPKDILKIVELETNTYWPDKRVPVNIELIIEKAKLEIIPEPLRLQEHFVQCYEKMQHSPCKKSPYHAPTFRCVRSNWLAYRWNST